jgi:leader peptidase (prepilin peptidase)/N-methyltransferase
VIYRLPRGESIVFPGSHCPKCGRAIKSYDNIPILSFLVLRGKCRFCKVQISPRYIIIEAITALLLVGLYVCYYVLGVRSGAGGFEHSWPMYASHAALFCGLLVCSAVDIELWIVPLEVCWFVSLVGLISSAIAPHPWMPGISPAWAAMSVAGSIGLIASLILQHYGLLQASFVDASDKPIAPPSEQADGSASDKAKARPKAVAFTKEHGVNPRVEILRELLFLAPAIVLAGIACLLVTKVDSLRLAWAGVLESPVTGRHIKGLLAAVMGYLVGGLWVWGTRILGTLAFGKEAMGLGDVHLMAAVGAVAGWIVPSVAFFLAPIFGLLWAVYLWLGRNQRELPYGPWLATASAAVMIFHDKLLWLFRAYLDTMTRQNL